MDLHILPETDSETWWCTEEMFGIHTFTRVRVSQMVNDIHSYLRCTLAPCTERSPKDSGSLRFMRLALRPVNRAKGGSEGWRMKRRRDRAEIQLSPLSFPTWRGRPKGPPFASVANGQDAHTEANGVACRASQGQRPHQ